MPLAEALVDTSSTDLMWKSGRTYLYVKDQFGIISAE